MNHFSNIPKDPDTRIIEQSEITINGLLVLKQYWSWDGIKANSLIFHSNDVKKLSDDELLKLIKNNSDIKFNSSITFSNKNDYRFVNYNFET